MFPARSFLLRALFVLTGLAFTPFQKKTITVYLIGDSTMSNKDQLAYPETGWGMPFSIFFDSTVRVDNRAMNGRSTKSFMAENRWQPVLTNLQPGDYVFIQFGHNDEVPTKQTYTSPQEFSANLTKYITDTRAKGAVPILLTPVARRRFDSTGQLQGTHEAYSALTRTVAAANQVLLIDLDQKSQQLLRNLGPVTSRMLFNWLEPGDHPNYPAGMKDDTHFNELGARLMAQIVLKDIRQTVPELATRIVQKPAGRQ